jgi:hypothetical protein
MKSLQQLSTAVSVNRAKGCCRLAALVILAALAGRAAAAPPLMRDTIVRRAADNGEALWQRIADAEPYGAMGSRSVFNYALALCEARRHPERLGRLFELGARAQDRDPKSPTYGNLKWYWRDAGVTDGNAVEFCMHDALRIWLRHKDWVPEPARQTLRELLDYSLEGCLRHRVATSYTNIAMLNAGNLIVLGEALGRPEAAEEGYRRLEAICLWTWQFGTHEYCSPTYYSVDLNGLAFIEEYAAREPGRQQARALLELLWTDIALNWFPSAEKLAGPHSRSYNYLQGLGSVDGYLALNGWLTSRNLEQQELFHSVLGRWSPPPRLRETNLRRFPRLVRQSWGLYLTGWRTHIMYPDVTLGCCGATYGQQDMPLTVDLPGDRDLVRCYFIADGREDPYGKKKYETGSARHLKALHLQPFWTAAQRNRDALGLVIYRKEDLSGREVTNLQSHFVLRRNVDGFWLGGRPLQVPKGTAAEPGRVAVEHGEALVLRCGTAAVAVRLLWARRQDGQTAAAAVVDDGNTYGALRLTVDHHCPEASIEAGAAFWVRIGSGLSSDAAFQRWRTQFEQAGPTSVEAGEQGVRLAVPGEEGPVSVAAGKPYGQSNTVVLEPPPARAVLECNGREIGRPLLEVVEPAHSCRNGINVARPLQVPAEGCVCWEAEDGLVFAGMMVGEDDGASARRYVWQPADAEVTRLPGTVMWPLYVAKAGRYYLWGRALATDPTADSFFVKLIGPSSDLLPRTAWPLRRADRWLWQRVSLEKSQQPTPWELPAGPCILQLQVREPGAKIDRLMLTSDADQQPE